MSSSPYTPKYGSVDEIPLTGPGSPGTPNEINHPFSDAEKRRALDVAESLLEAEVNEGFEITNPERSHANAANAMASYQLAFGPQAPSSMRSGDFADAGGDLQAYAENYLELYNKFVTAINNASGDESGGGSAGGGTDGGDGGTGGYDAGTVDLEVF